jgi:shikimate kinase
MNIVLIGMKHCGKSTAARGLARRCDGTAIDTDDVLAECYTADTGEQKSVREIFCERGDAGFAELERQALQAILHRIDQGETGLVVALGGRTAMRDTLQPLIKRIGRVIYLQANFETLFDRVRAGGLPPFLDAADPKGSFFALCRERAEVYEAFADEILPIDGLSPSQVVDALSECLESAG